MRAPCAARCRRRRAQSIGVGSIYSQAAASTEPASTPCAQLVLGDPVGVEHVVQVVLGDRDRLEDDRRDGVLARALERRRSSRSRVPGGGEIVRRPRQGQRCGLAQLHRAAPASPSDAFFQTSTACAPLATRFRAAVSPSWPETGIWRSPWPRAQPRRRPPCCRSRTAPRRSRCRCGRGSLHVVLRDRRYPSCRCTVSPTIVIASLVSLTSGMPASVIARAAGSRSSGRSRSPLMIDVVALRHRSNMASASSVPTPTLSNVM